jgi:Na+-driven multidrug efflux pump
VGAVGGFIASTANLGAAGTALATAVSAGAGMAAGFMVARRADRAFRRNVFENTVVRPLGDDEA